MTNRKLIICASLLYEFQLGTSASFACRKLRTAFGEGAVSERTARNWFQKFRSGNETLEDEPRAGRPISLNNDNLKAAIESDLCLTCHKLASRFHVSDETITLCLPWGPMDPQVKFALLILRTYSRYGLEIP